MEGLYRTSQNIVLLKCLILLPSGKAFFHGKDRVSKGSKKKLLHLLLLFVLLCLIYTVNSTFATLRHICSYLIYISF